MSSARSAILRRIRASLDAKADDAARTQAAEERIAAHARQLVPARAKGATNEQAALFRSFLEGQLATVVEVAEARSVPVAVHAYLTGNGLRPSVRLGGDPRLTAMPWEGATGLETLQGAGAPDDPNGLSFALCGIAETGTLLIAAGADNPVTLAFLPPTHIIIVERGTIVGSYEEAIDKVRQAFGPTGMPRTLNYISGPSRTADIGGKIVIGAHGPRNLCVMIVG
ncbi:MAG: lactate utilization protein C [Hyphomicrobiaceae bacterium]